jgi:hypothetical protein
VITEYDHDKKYPVFGFGGRRAGGTVRKTKTNAKIKRGPLEHVLDEKVSKSGPRKLG